MPALTDALRSAVRHKQWRTAAPLLKALASFGTRAVAALETVRPLTEVDDQETRTAATSAVWEIERRPEHVLPLLQRLLDGKRNFEAIDLAGRIGPPAAAVLPRLRHLLNDRLEGNARNEPEGSVVLNVTGVRTPPRGRTRRGGARRAPGNLQVPFQSPDGPRPPSRSRVATAPPSGAFAKVSLAPRTSACPSAMVSPSP